MIDLLIKIQGPLSSLHNFRTLLWELDLDFVVKYSSKTDTCGEEYFMLSLWSEELLKLEKFIKEDRLAVFTVERE